MNAINATIGFMGTGGIATALAKGFCGSQDFNGRVFVFDPNTERTEALSALYPNKAVTAKSNQEVIENAEFIFPTLLPGVLRKVAPTLNFRKENRIIHLAAGIKIEEAQPWFEPAASVVRCVPLPFASKRIGPVIYYGDDAKSESILALLGSVVKVESEKHLEILAVVTGMMVSYYACVGETIKWGMSKGIDFQSILKYTTFMNEALSTLMRNDCTEDIETFLIENSTPHGMNELGLKIMRDANAYGPWTEALEQIGKHYQL